MSVPPIKPMFMSDRHVEMMNTILATDYSSKTECGRLDRSYWMCYELMQGEHTVLWSVEFSPRHGVRFSLEPPVGAEPDVLFRGDYRAVVEATRLGKEGKDSPLPITTHGDPGVMAIIGPAFAAARRAATIPSEFPTD